MANSNATQIQINLQDNLNLNSNKSEISNFTGFRKRNSPFFNGGVSPLFTQEKTGSVIDKEGNVYKCENGNFYKNDEVIATGIEQQEFVKTKIEGPSDSSVKWCFDSAMNMFTAKVLNVNSSDYYRADIEVNYKGKTYTITSAYANVQVGSLCDFYNYTNTGESDRNPYKKYLYVVCWSSVKAGSGGTSDSSDFQIHIFKDYGNSQMNTLEEYAANTCSHLGSSLEEATISRVVVGYNSHFKLSIVDISETTTTTTTEAFYAQCFPTNDTTMKSKGYTIGYVLPKTVTHRGSPISGTYKSYESTDPELFLVKENKIERSVVTGDIDTSWTNAVFYNGRFKSGSKFYSAYYIGMKITEQGTGSSWYAVSTFEPLDMTATGKQSATLPGTISDNDNYVFCDGETFYANGIITLNSKKISVSHHDGKALWVGEGCGPADSDGHYSSFSKNFIFVNQNDMFTLLYNNNAISGISFNGTLLTPFLDVKTTADFIVQRITAPNYTGEHRSQSKGILYRSASDNNFYTLFRRPQTNIKMSLIDDRYVFMNTVGFYNAYDIKKGLFIHFCTDMNGRFYTGKSVTSTLTADQINEEPQMIAVGVNANYEIKIDPVVGAIFNPLIMYATLKTLDVKIDNSNLLDILTRRVPEGNFYKTLFIYSTFSGSVETQYVDIYTFIGDSGQRPVYKFSYYLDGSIDSHVLDTDLIGVSYPSETGGNIILSPSLFAIYFDSQIGADYIKDGRYYNLIYYEGLPLLAYYYGSGVANSEARFVIQGQSFVIRNGLIYSTYYSDGLMSVNDAIVNVDDLKFIGALPLAAFFFSPATKCVLGFTGDRNLRTVFEATEMKAVLNYKYAPNNNSLYLATQEAVYVLYNTAEGNSYMYKIEESDITDFVPLNDGCVAMKCGDIWKIYSFFEREGFERVPVKLNTKFYGAGQNRVSTIDCWYIRLFSETPVKGSVKVRVESITNKSVESEDQIFNIAKEDWDTNNNFYYLRFQPKLQRGAGMSLNIESDFAVFDVQASLNADSTIQLSTPKGI